MARAKTSRKRVLMLAHHYPPVGGVSGRNVATARYLPEFGYDPVVLTGPGNRDQRFVPRDEGMLERIGGAEVHRLSGPVPGERTRGRQRLDRWLERPLPWVHWWVAEATREGRSIGGEIDLIFASLIPYETASAAAELSRLLGKPWVADLEDPWALDEMRVAPTAVNHHVDRLRMRRSLESASALIMSCNEAASRVRRELPQWHDKLVTAIPHGFDREDYVGALPDRGDDAFRIVHTGSLHTQLGRDHRRSARARRLLGGTSLDVDILTRSHVFLLEAIERLAQSDPALVARVELHLAGHLTPADRELVERRPFVRTYGQLPHSETVALARSADLLFLPMHDLPHGERAGIVPCKTYEYLATGRPILAAVPDGDARDLLGQFERVTLCRPADVAAMAEAIRARAAGDGARPDAAAPDDPELRGLERRRLTRRIADVLDDVAADAPAAAVA
jgi:glycosyltransferase involved in cell wall biosynthesis